MSQIILASETMIPTEEELTKPTSREQLGLILKQRREELGQSVSQIAKSTCIRSAIITALEEGNFDKLGGETYIKGFVKTYAQTLNLSPEPLMELYAAEPVVEKYMHPFDVAFPTPSAIAPSKKLIFMSVFMLITILIAFSLYDRHVRSIERAPAIDMGKFEPYLEEIENAAPAQLAAAQPSSVALTAFGTEQKLLKTVSKNHREYLNSENVMLSPLQDGWIELYQDDNLLMRTQLRADKNYIFHKEPDMALVAKDGNWLQASFKGKALPFAKSATCDDHSCEFPG